MDVMQQQFQLCQHQSQQRGEYIKQLVSQLQEMQMENSRLRIRLQMAETQLPNIIRAPQTNAPRQSSPTTPQKYIVSAPSSPKTFTTPQHYPAHGYYTSPSKQVFTASSVHSMNSLSESRSCSLSVSSSVPEIVDEIIASDSFPRPMHGAYSPPAKAYIVGQSHDSHPTTPVLIHSDYQGFAQKQHF